MDRGDLLSDIGFACSARLCHVASGNFDADPGFSSPVGSPSADCTLDDPNLALCFSHWRACLFDALQMVSTGSVTLWCLRLSGFMQQRARRMRSGQRTLEQRSANNGLRQILRSAGI